MNSKQNAMVILFALGSILLSSTANSKETGGFKPIAVKTTPPEYRWISHISSGPSDTSILDDSPDGIRGRFYRLVFISNDDVFSRPIMRIDEIVYADAGCCWTVNKSWNADFNKLEKSGVKMPPPESSDIDSVIWLNIRAAKIKYGKSECTISGIGEENIFAKCELR